VARRSDALAVTDSASRVRFEVRVAAPWADRVAVTPPEPNAPGCVVRADVRAPAVFGGPRPPRRLGHLVLGTPDFAATRDLLIDGLGFRVSDEIPGIIGFYRCSPDHHNLALVESPVPLLQHYSWECDDVDHVGHSATALLRTDPDRQAWGFGRHFAGSNFYWYLRDPAGSFVELYSDLDQILDDEAWEARGRTPFEFEHLANSWGPEIPLEFIQPNDLETLQAGWAAIDA
jgi:catechol 2,3-dioxygenase-like lactoylglutathione lyase family enzyme